MSVTEGSSGSEAAVPVIIRNKLNSGSNDDSDGEDDDETSLWEHLVDAAEPSVMFSLENDEDFALDDD